MDGLIPISSRDNQYLKLARSLGKGKARRQQGCFLLEGLRLAEEALKTAWPIEYGLISHMAAEEPRAAAIVNRLQAQGVRVYAVAENMLQQAADTEHSQGLLLIGSLPKPIPAKIPEQGDFLLLADHISDPGNLGALMRTAWAAGADALLLTPGCADPFSPKVVRASMGAVLRLPILSFDDEDDLLKQLQKKGLQLLAAAANGSYRYDKANLQQPLVWLLGAEADGLSKFWQAAAGQRVYLPMAQGAESLNVAAAGAVLMYATAAQRGFPKA